MTRNLHDMRRRRYSHRAAVAAAVFVLLAPALACHRLHAQEPAAKQAAAPRFTNKLAGASSPYLLEHAHNPVNWYPWGSEALEKARRENKPIFLSVGYSACHWCHVMAREDFENEEIAGILNAHFVAIKVDREQRPEIDAQYMLAVQMMTGSGGWPMSVFLTPERKPFFGGTYFPPDEFKSLLNRIVEVCDKQPEAVKTQAEKVAAAIARAARPEAPGPLAAGLLDRAVADLHSRFDSMEGGFSKQPKFPEAPALAFLLARYRKSGDKTALSMVTTTLDHMAAGGIYDQIGGGFHRYSTDSRWRVPHFEKMLYDQAQLVLVYLDAYEITRKPRYRQVAEETLAFVGREMRDPAGGFTSTLDADSEGEEGKFYLWRPEQVKAVLGEDASTFEGLFGVSATGDLDGKSVLHVASGVEEVAAKRHADTPEFSRRVDAMRRKMLEARGTRVRPRCDDKVLASWNGLMVAACARAFQVLKDDRYRKTAEVAARFLTQKMMPDGALMHSYHSGTTEVPGLLEDYACCAFGLQTLAESTGDVTWRKTAESLADRMVTRFSDPQSGGFFAASAESQGDLLARLKESEDNAMPSGNGMAALVLARDSRGGSASRAAAIRAIEAFQPIETRAPSAFPTLLTAYQEIGAPAVSRSSPGTVQIRADAFGGSPGDVVTVTIHVQIPAGWHINAHGASAGSLIPTELTLATEAGFALEKVAYPEGKAAHFAFAEKPLSVYEGSVTLKARLRLNRSASTGPHHVRFTLKYQACNDRSCLAPASADVVAEPEVKR